MEWVETTAKTVDEAKEKALDQLGVAMEDAEFDVLDEPKPGLFGRLRGEARVRARVRPTQARQKVDRRDRRREKADKTDKTDKADKAEVTKTADTATPTPRGGSRSKPKKSTAAAAEPAPAAPAAPVTPKEHPVDAHQVGEEARRFVDGLLEAFGLEGEVTLVEDGDDLELRVDGQELGLLVGPRGTTLQAVQDLARVASQRRLDGLARGLGGCRPSLNAWGWSPGARAGPWRSSSPPRRRPPSSRTSSSTSAGRAC